jgi:hypothetical protein
MVSIFFYIYFDLFVSCLMPCKLCETTVIIRNVFIFICFVFFWLIPDPVVSLTNFQIHGMYYVMLCYVMSGNEIQDPLDKRLGGLQGLFVVGGEKKYPCLELNLVSRLQLTLWSIIIFCLKSLYSSILNFFVCLLGDITSFLCKELSMFTAVSLLGNHLMA